MMETVFVSNWIRRVSQALALAAAVGCSETPPAVAPTDGLPRYGAIDALLFDDVLRADLFGLEAPPDPRLADRMRAATTVIPVKISTITGDRAEHTAFRMRLVPTADALRGVTPRQAVDVTVAEHSPTYPWVREADEELVGLRFILAYRVYNDGGVPVVHFHGIPDTEAHRELARASMPPAASPETP